jgi:hypothetical protein
MMDLRDSDLDPGRIYEPEPVRELARNRERTARMPGSGVTEFVPKPTGYIEPIETPLSPEGSEPIYRSSNEAQAAPSSSSVVPSSAAAVPAYTPPAVSPSPMAQPVPTVPRASVPARPYLPYAPATEPDGFSTLPSWVMPVAIAGGALLLLMLLMRRR